MGRIKRTRKKFNGRIKIELITFSWFVFERGRAGERRKQRERVSLVRENNNVFTSTVVAIVIFLLLYSEVYLANVYADSPKT